MMKYLPLISVLALCSCSTTPQAAQQASARTANIQADLEAELAGLVPGKPAVCLPVALRTQVNSRTFGSTVVYSVSDREKYRTETTGGCATASNGRGFLVTNNPIGRSCRGDIVQVIDPITNVALGSCALGEFVPYTRP